MEHAEAASLRHLVHGPNVGSCDCGDTHHYNLLLRSSQPAALSTTLLVTLGQMQTGRDALAIIAGVILIAIVGEPIRRARLKFMQSDSTDS